MTRYGNEADVGRAVLDHCASSGASRSDIFVTSKLQRNRGYDAAFADLRASLARSKLDYFDLFLLHSPLGGPSARAEGWRALVDAKRTGLVRSVGVSNFGVLHLAEIAEMVRRAGDEGPGGLMPAVNQVDLHPFTRHEGVVEMCGEMGTLTQAWGPLARGKRFQHPAIQRVADKYARTPAQIMLRWGLQHVSSRPRPGWADARDTLSSRSQCRRSVSSRMPTCLTLRSHPRTWAR